LKSKPELELCIGILLTSKTKPKVLRSSSSVEFLCSLATTKRPGVDIRKVETYHQIFLAPLAVNILLFSHIDMSTWPTAFIKVNSDKTMSSLRFE